MKHDPPAADSELDQRSISNLRPPQNPRTFGVAEEPRVCGEGEIRTHGRLASTIVFKTISINHSDTSPNSVNFNRYEPIDKVKEISYYQIVTEQIIIITNGLK